MGIHRGPNTVSDGLVFGCDTGYGVADNNTATRFYPGEPTVNLLDNSDDWSSNWTGNLFSNWINATVTPNAGVAPDGTTTASKLTGGYSRWQRINCSTSTTYTFSFWIKNIDLPIAPQIHIAFGLNGSLVNYNNVTTIALNTIGEWTRVSKTHTSPSSGINQMEVGVAWSSNYPNTDSVLVWHAMCEQNSHMTPFAYKNNDRSSTQSLIDLKKTTSIDVSNVSFDSTGQPTFDNTDDRIIMSNSSVFNHTSQLTIESWVKFDGDSDDFIFEKGNVNTQYSLFSHGNDIVFRTYHAGDSGYQTLAPSKGTAGITNGVWHHIVGSWDGSTKRIYVDGVDKASVSKSGALTANLDGAAIGSFGGTSSGYYFGGDIAIVKIYDKGLSAAEVKQNYNAYKNRFDI